MRHAPVPGFLPAYVLAAELPPRRLRLRDGLQPGEAGGPAGGPRRAVRDPGRRRSHHQHRAEVRQRRRENRARAVHCRRAGKHGRGCGQPARQAGGGAPGLSLPLLHERHPALRHPLVRGGSGHHLRGAARPCAREPRAGPQACRRGGGPAAGRPRRRLVPAAPAPRPADHPHARPEAAELRRRPARSVHRRRGGVRGRRRQDGRHPVRRREPGRRRCLHGDLLLHRQQRRRRVAALPHHHGRREGGAAGRRALARVPPAGAGHRPRRTRVRDARLRRQLPDAGLDRALLPARQVRV